MGEQTVRGSQRGIGRLKLLGWVGLVLSVALVMVAVMLPPQTLAWLRSDIRPFGRALNWLEMMSPWLDLTHVILFAWVGFLASCLRRRAPWWHVALPLLVLSIATELLQYLVPGRTPLLSDLDDDLLGVAIGMLLALPLRAVTGRPGH